MRITPNIKKCYLTLILLILFAYPLFGGPFDDNPTAGHNSNHNLLQTKWTEGWYFLAGMGPSGGILINNKSYLRSNSGLNLSTNVGYAAFNAVGLEIGSFVSVQYFNNIPHSSDEERPDLGRVIFWDTIFYWALRVRIPNLRYTNTFNPYIKMLQGRGQGVGFLFNMNEKYKYLEKSRIQLEGPVYGFAIGNLFNLQDKRTIWFLELTVLVQIYWDGYVVQSTQELPVILEKVNLQDNDHKVQIHLTFGFRFF